MPHSREELVQHAERVVELDELSVCQLDMVQELGISQTLISQLRSITDEGDPAVYEAWKAGEITTETAWSLSRLDDAEAQLAMLATRPLEGSQAQWNREVARVSKRKKRPDIKDLRKLVAALEKMEPKKKSIKAVIAALEYSSGDKTLDELAKFMK
jgi:hypothetical protein